MHALVIIMAIKQYVPSVMDLPKSERVFLAAEEVVSDHGLTVVPASEQFI